MGLRLSELFDILRHVGRALATCATSRRDIEPRSTVSRRYLPAVWGTYDKGLEDGVLRNASAAFTTTHTALLGRQGCTSGDPLASA